MIPAEVSARRVPILDRMTTTGAAVAAVAALPSVCWAIVGAGYLSDDFGVAGLIARKGLGEAAWSLAFVGPARPTAAPYYLLLYEGVGARMALQALILAVLNAAAAVLLWLALRSVVSQRTALVAAAVFAIAPNRGSTRLWFVLGPNLLAVACLAGAVIVLYKYSRLACAVALLLVGILAYEGIAGIAPLVIGGWWLQQPRPRPARALQALLVVAGVTLAAWVVSPKRHDAGPGPFDHVDTIASGVVGAGFWGTNLVGALGIAVVLVAVTVSLATLLPSFRRAGTLQREVRIGASILVVALGPFVVGGAPFAVRGIFDRNNLVPGIGVSLILGALVAAIGRWRASVGTAVALVVVAVLAIGNVRDVQDYRAAVREGRALEQAIVADVDPTAGTIVVLPPLAGEHGVAQFILDDDLTAALELRHGPAWASVSMPYLQDTCRRQLGSALAAGEPAFVYHRVARSLERVQSDAACRQG